ncbi:I78 family peptidase inhibitor [Streptomyces sp. NPDC020875]|uniref:I78 family peptidase inhibitor n=1 Tax=Streptomyces sp. NPDC020875 TaxID=3154898 RepID=UPI00340C87D4
MAPRPQPPAAPDDNGAEGADATEAYVGLAADAAERRASARGWTTVRTLPPGAIITLEYLRGRINFEVEHGTVIRCWRG